MGKEGGRGYNVTDMNARSGLATNGRYYIYITPPLRGLRYPMSLMSYMVILVSDQILAFANLSADVFV